MAHAICVPEIKRRGWGVEVYSAGVMDFTGTPIVIPTWMTCCQNNTPPQKDYPTFVRDLPLLSIDRFFVMEKPHAAILIADYGISSSLISLLGSFDPKSEGDEIEDPMNQSSVKFERCYARIRRCIFHYFDITTEIPQPLLPELQKRKLNIDNVVT
jgi:protein-tyrosine-phosphatase